MSYARRSDVEVLLVEERAVYVPHRHTALKGLSLCLGVGHRPLKLSVLAQLLGRRLERLSRLIVHDDAGFYPRDAVEGSVDEAVCRRTADEASADEEGVSWVFSLGYLDGLISRGRFLLPFGRDGPTTSIRHD